KKAVKELKIDIKKSFLIGDSTGDILAGRRAGIKTIMVKTGYGGKDGKYKVKPDFTASNLIQAVKIIRQQVY
ncbi:MAG: HAD hydrolase-like protein, partial [Patescibacteria group bacterium]